MENFNFITYLKSIGFKCSVEEYNKKMEARGYAERISFGNTRDLYLENFHIHIVYDITETGKKEVDYIMIFKNGKAQKLQTYEDKRYESNLAFTFPQREDFSYRQKETWEQILKQINN